MVQQRLSEMAAPLVVPDKVAMIDIDGTLIDKTYSITDDQIYAAIQDAQQEGWRIGLSSDTPHETMKEWHEEFGMNGPIISEKGALVAVGDQISPTADSSYDFVALRNAFLETVDPETIIFRGNSVQFLRSGTQMIGQPGDKVLFINERRNHSLGFHARTIGNDGQLTVDSGLTNTLAEQLRSLYPDTISFDEDLNHEHGLLIVSHKEMDKRTGTIELQRMMGIGRVAMVGNSWADFVGSDIAAHLAVGDATEQYKEVADFVAQKHLTSGVIEALDTLVKNN